MSALSDLYAERDLLRSRREELNRKFEALVPLETKNRLAINDLLLKNPYTEDRSYHRPILKSLDLEETPEFMNVRMVD